jgi:hypothetical protein
MNGFWMANLCNSVWEEMTTSVGMTACFA